MDNLIKQAINCLENNGLISLPTETVYSISCNAYSNIAVEKIYNLKDRKRENPLALLIGSIRQAREIVEFSEQALLLAEAFFPGPLTIILNKLPNTELAGNINKNSNTIAIRMPKHDIALAILQAANFPIIGTSANPSGMPPATDIIGVKQYFPRGIDMIIDGGKADIGIASTVIDLSGKDLKIIRQGVVTEKQIREVL